MIKQPMMMKSTVVILVITIFVTHLLKPRIVGSEDFFLQIVIVIYYLDTALCIIYNPACTKTSKEKPK